MLWQTRLLRMAVLPFPGCADGRDFGCGRCWAGRGRAGHKNRPLAAARGKKGSSGNRTRGLLDPNEESYH